MKKNKFKSHLTDKERIALLEKKNTDLQNELNSMESRYEEAYVNYKIFQDLFINEMAGEKKEALLFYYTFLALRNIKTSDLKKDTLVKKTMKEISNKYNIYPEEELIDKPYKEEYYSPKMDKLYRTFYTHWRDKFINIRKEYFRLYEIHSNDIPLYNPLETIP
jgi:hypothetical protein